MLQPSNASQPISVMHSEGFCQIHATEEKGGLKEKK